MKLAEYVKGQFVGYLRVGKDFLYGKEFIGVYPRTLIEALSKCTIFSREGFYKFMLDERDPLNRFDGKFNGRTYCNGRFVLVDWDWDNGAVEVEKGHPLFEQGYAGSEFEYEGVVTSTILYSIHERPDLHQLALNTNNFLRYEEKEA